MQFVEMHARTLCALPTIGRSWEKRPFKQLLIAMAQVREIEPDQNGLALRFIIQFFANKWGWEKLENSVRAAKVPDWTGSPIQSLFDDMLADNIERETRRRLHEERQAAEKLAAEKRRWERQQNHEARRKTAEEWAAMSKPAQGAPDDEKD